MPQLSVFSAQDPEFGCGLPSESTMYMHGVLHLYTQDPGAMQPGYACCNPWVGAPSFWWGSLFVGVLNKETYVLGSILGPLIFESSYIAP